MQMLTEHLKERSVKGWVAAQPLVDQHSEMPKSLSTTSSVALSRRFSGLISRWITRC